MKRERTDFLKRLIAALSFLVIAIGLCIFEQYTVEKTYQQTNEIINTAIEYAENKDYEKTTQECKKLNEFFNEKYPYLTAMIEHGCLDETKMTISSLVDLAENESEELESELITAKNQIKTIRDNQKVTFGNVF